MNCKISCSFGEIVDKVTILRIKKSKAINPFVLSNIEKELNIIQKENIKVNNNDILFDKLSDINKKLWNLEDSIRDKSKKKEFDEEYINLAESIHITNDERYLLKKQINQKYNSSLIEEKIYNSKKILKYDTFKVNINDYKQLEIGKELYTIGNYNKSISIIEKIMKKYQNYDLIDSFFIDLLFSYYNILSIFNKSFPYFQKIKEIMKNLNVINISEQQKKFCKRNFIKMCFIYKEYKLSYKFINYADTFHGPNVNCENTSFFKKNDKYKILLIYDGGGLGDKFMLSRFIPTLCENNKDNKIVFFCDDNLTWFFKKIYNEIQNILIIPYTKYYILPKFDYHCSLISLIKHLNITYDNLYTDNFIKKIKLNISDKCKKIINNFNKKTFIINWKGNPKNTHEKHNRMMNLLNAVPLFEISSINWIVISHNINADEIKIMNKYNVKYYSNLDQEKSFYDTISILRNVDGVVSTDTSLPHLSLSLGIKTYVLLTLGCEWRWLRNDTTNWYPNAILLRQKSLKNWDYPINKLKNILN